MADEERDEAQELTKGRLLKLVGLFIVLSVIFWIGIKLLGGSGETTDGTYEITPTAEEITSEPVEHTDETLQEFISNIKNDITMVMMYEYPSIGDNTDEQTYKMFKPIRDRLGKQKGVDFKVGLKEGTLSSDGKTEIVLDVTVYDNKDIPLKFRYLMSYATKTNRWGKADYYVVNSTLIEE